MRPRPLRVSLISLSSLALASLLTVLTACSDDDEGPSDAAADGGEEDSGTNFIPRLDGQVSGGEPLPPCERFTQGVCPADESCEEIFVVDAVAGDQYLYPACIKRSTPARGEGDPCAQFSELYEAPETSDEIYVDPCGPGLFCAADPRVRDAFSCQAACQTGAFGDVPVACESGLSYCLRVDRFQEICRTSDGCNPASQAGCSTGEACYLRLNDRGDGALAVCLAPPEVAVDDGDNCQYINDCEPGSACLGSIQTPPDTWTAESFTCQPFCTGDASSDDAGVDEGDSGPTAASGCASGSQCVPFADVDFELVGVASGPAGRCEP
jgi:hypothetical protein